ncbi:MAG: hypothetical protein ACQGVK_15670 [Myxococcota bacterium]
MIGGIEIRQANGDLTFNYGGEPVFVLFPSSEPASSTAATIATAAGYAAWFPPLSFVATLLQVGALLYQGDTIGALTAIPGLLEPIGKALEGGGPAPGINRRSRSVRRGRKCPPS